MYVSAHLSIPLLPQKFLYETRRERKRGEKRGRVLQWQTQSVMQDYSVSFSTAIDVVFMGETEGFSKCSGPCHTRFILETKAEGGGGWRGVSPCGLCCLMAAISIPDAGKKVFPGDRFEGDLGSHPHTLEVGSILHLRMQRGGDLGRRLETRHFFLMLGFVRGDCVCLRGYFRLCVS